jgi:hypothetical protein
MDERAEHPEKHSSESVLTNWWNDLSPEGVISISSDYLWFLIDHDFIVDDVKRMMTFVKHTGY